MPCLVTYACVTRGYGLSKVSTIQLWSGLRVCKSEIRLLRNLVQVSARNSIWKPLETSISMSVITILVQQAKAIPLIIHEGSLNFKDPFYLQAAIFIINVIFKMLQLCKEHGNTALQYISVALEQILSQSITFCISVSIPITMTVSLSFSIAITTPVARGYHYLYQYRCHYLCRKAPNLRVRTQRFYTTFLLVQADPKSADFYRTLNIEDLPQLPDF